MKTCARPYSRLCEAPSRIGCASLLGCALGVLAIFPNAAFAQGAHANTLDAHEDALDAFDAAIYAMPHANDEGPGDSMYATAPAQEARVPTQFQFRGLLPLGYNTNVEERGNGGSDSGDFWPRGDLSVTAPAGQLPIRLTGSIGAEGENYFAVPSENIQYLRAQLRAQYVDSNNDQAFSPYFAIAPRNTFINGFGTQISARQDFNLGIQKRWNLGSDFQLVPIAGSTSSATALSFGLTVIGQRRERSPQVGSEAIYIIPSVSYEITDDLSVSAEVEALSRWFDGNAAGFERHDYEVVPVATLEYVLPVSFFGGNSDLRRHLGRPAFDLQQGYTHVWSNRADGGFSQSLTRGVLSLRWRF